MSSVNRYRRPRTARRKLTTPRMRLLFGVYMLGMMLFWGVIYLATSNMSIASLIWFIISMLMAVRIFATQPEYKRRYENYSNKLVIADPVNEDGEAFEDRTQSLRKDYSVPKIDKFAFDKYYAYIVGLFILIYIGYLLRNIGSLTYEEFVKYLPIAILPAYLIILALAHRLCLPRNKEDRSRFQRICFLILAIVLCLSFSGVIFIFYPDLLICILVALSIFLISVIIVTKTFQLSEPVYEQI